MNVAKCMKSMSVSKYLKRPIFKSYSNFEKK